jgi:hypothetical protein
LTTILSSSIYGWNNLPIGDLLNRVIVVSQVGEHNSNFNVGFMVGISNWLVGFVNQLIAGGHFLVEMNNHNNWQKNGPT